MIIREDNITEMEFKELKKMAERQIGLDKYVELMELYNYSKDIEQDPSWGHRLGIMSVFMAGYTKGKREERKKEKKKIK